MVTIVTRETGATAKNAPLSSGEVDANFINLNTGKVEVTAVGAPSGVASLDGAGKIPGTQLPDISKTGVGLGNVDNTSDADKPVSTAQAAALSGKANASHVHAVSTNVAAGFMSAADRIKLDGIAAGAQPNNISSVAGRTGAIVLNSADVGLNLVNNTADTAKPVSTAQQAALNLKANLASPAFTGTPTGITKAHVGLSAVDNTSDMAKPVSTATTAAIGVSTRDSINASGYAHTPDQSDLLPLLQAATSNSLKKIQYGTFLNEVLSRVYLNLGLGSSATDFSNSFNSLGYGLVRASTGANSLTASRNWPVLAGTAARRWNILSMGGVGNSTQLLTQTFATGTAAEAITNAFFIRTQGSSGVYGDWERIIGENYADTQYARITHAGNLFKNAFNTFEKTHANGANGGTITLTPPSGGVGRKSGISLLATFTGTTDTGPRRAADITAWYDGQWGGERLTFGVGNNGGANDTNSDTTPRLTITGEGKILSAGGTVGYGFGAGGVATQPTSKNAGVILHKPSGIIIMHNAYLGPGVTVAFQLFSNKAAQSILAVSIAHSYSDRYTVSSGTIDAVGNHMIYVKNETGTGFSEPVVIYFAAIAISDV